MPNVGRPSRGCSECKNRKVKCDQEVPNCGRCVRNGRECPGYPTASDVTFRNTLSTDVQRRQKLSASADSSASVSRRVSIASPMPIDWQAQAVSFFFHDYIIAPSESTVGFGFLQGLPPMLAQGSDPGAYHEAVSAVALASFAHRSSLDYLAIQARQRYGKALQLSSQTLRRSGELSKDSTLATVLCLGLYEIISGEKPPWSRDWSSHIHILPYLLYVRRLAPLDTTDSRQLTQNAHVFIQIRNLSTRVRPSREAELIINDPRQDDHVRKSGNLVCKVCHFLADADEILRLIPSIVPIREVEKRLRDVIAKGLDLDKELENWGTQVSGKSIYTDIKAGCLAPSLSTGIDQIPSIHIYSSASMAASWNLLRCTRILLLHCLRQCLERQAQITPLPQELPIAANTYTTNSITTEKLPPLFADICASVPYLLGEIDQDGNLQPPRNRKAVGGYFLMWPLRLMLHYGPTDEAQKLWIERQLTYIRANMGIKQATDPYVYAI